MAWRGLHISRPARLTGRNRQIVVSQDDGEVRFPIEDIAWIILDTPQVTVSGGLLSSLVTDGVATIVPDARHHPAGVLLPFHQHYEQSHVAHVQVGIGQPLKKRLWQALVVAKIRNQAAVLRDRGRPAVQAVLAMAGRVGSGDPGNVEAQAARAYWPALFADFTRGDAGDRRNALLNYGYAVVRAALARACAASGLLPAFGVHHAARANPFNLVDDLIEPFRPFVDRLASERADERAEAALSVEDRRAMADILNRTVTLAGDAMTVLAATEAVVPTLVRAMTENRAALLKTPAWPDAA